ncbi:DUF3718 domain-containing protein [Alteromonas sp. 345S023]|uniref:DUF3718 domain-containing protein n=1 Tax=Alteromonas profundi TaxID=2696062 RepID=A0A7X5LHZ9_9ALTE|nr:DUF3718 domain-containing protein [Alteromonas profundi]NDV89711.1 DUF3718 domain-containing protein [Alteromonas profundi]
MSISRRVTLSTLLGLSLTLLAGTASAKGYPVAIEDQLIAVCKAIKSDNRLALIRAVKKTRLSYRELNKGLVCNGQDMLTFALTHNATSTSQLIARRTNTQVGTLTAQY